MEVSGKIALITSGAHRVGKAVTLALARAGAHVVINYFRSADAAESTSREAQQLGVETLVCRCDIADPRQVEAMVNQAADRFGRVDILVNNAGLWEATPFPMTSFTGWQRVIDITINGSFYCANYVAPLMLRNRDGAIVNIVDASAFRPFRGYFAHSVAKSALLGMTRQLALELAPDVRVNAVAPGPVLPPPEYSPQKVQRTAERTLLQRWGRPEDVSDAVMFLVKADYITGETIIVDGGEQFGRFRQ